MEYEMGTKEKSGSAVEEKSVGLPISNPALQRRIFVAQLCLKISSILFTLGAISITVTSTQSIMLFGKFKFKATYSYSSAIKFLVGVDAIVCGFSALSLIFFYLLKRSGSQIMNYFFILILHDMVMMVLMVSGCAAATAIGYVGQYGEKEIMWHSVCGYVHKFCSRMMIAVAFSYLTFFAYLLLTLISAHALVFRFTT